MNRYLAFWGALLAASGIVTHFLLIGLGAEPFFMAMYYIPPAQVAAAGIAVAGALLVVASVFVDWPRYFPLGNETVARYFARLALLNALAAVVFTAPMLAPPLDLPILLTEWPGIYIFVAYSSFLIFGVVGMLCWSVMYRSSPAYFSRGTFDGRSVMLQLILSELGVYSISTFLFLAGFVGASLVHGGSVGIVFVGASMEFSDIPTAISVFGIMVSVVLGVITILTGKDVRVEAALEAVEHPASAGGGLQARAPAGEPEPPVGQRRPLAVKKV
ncbi:MAG: hypothetical protein JRN58_05550 [Nitrososphaerota archaeon]|nr:hypothetical protein [Nitrososphaerota archaeon]